MCEIAILDPKKYSRVEMVDAAIELYQAMGTSLGLVFVQESDDKTQFEYDIFKTIEPETENIAAFVEEHEDGAVRFIIHGRLATHGANTVENCHPLEVECEHCAVDYVIHNGVVTNYHQLRREAISQGHTFETKVDSEVIAHEYGGVPRDFEEETLDVAIPEQPAYILLDSHGVFINAPRYHLSERGEMAHRYRKFGPETRETNYQNVILTPTNAE